jgi:hypothetical protein
MLRFPVFRKRKTHVEDLPCVVQAPEAGLVFLIHASLHSAEVLKGKRHPKPTFPKTKSWKKRGVASTQPIFFPSFPFPHAGRHLSTPGCFYRHPHFFFQRPTLFFSFLEIAQRFCFW